MSSPIRLNKPVFNIDSNNKIIRSDQYQNYLKAKSLLEQAENQKKLIIADAKAQREKEKNRGYEDGKAQSQREQIAHRIDTVGKTIRYIQSIEEKLAHLVVDATRQIIGQFDDVEVAFAVVKKALHLVSKEKQIILHVAPEHVEQLQSRIHEILVDYPGISFIEIIADPRLEKGGCRLESPMGLIDASIEVQLSALQKALLENF